MIKRNILTKMKKVQNLIQYNKDNFIDIKTFSKHNVKLSNIYTTLASKLYN